MINSMELKATTQYNIMMSIYENSMPEMYIKLLGTGDDIYEFHHTLWGLPFYKKMIEVSKGLNTTKYIYISDRNCASSNLFFMYELTYRHFSLKGTHSIEKRIIDVHENRDEYIELFTLIYNKEQANNVPSTIWNYTILL